ncbi:MAG: UTP--glucose-1-phosphate uridylyltransferase [Planctomycetes bacterium]|nr:UTP--glucose-1-phosphate uridylyltransferase [Planctomycetota bacterium]
MSIDIAVVPVAGRGTRLLPATKSQPKEMLPVGRKPVVQYVVEELAKSEIRRLLFITDSRKTQIENHFDEDGELIDFLRRTGREEQLADLEFERQKMEYFYTRQRRQLGLGHAVLCAKPLIGDQPFVVALGDSIIGLHAESDIVRRMIRHFEATGAEAVVAFEQVPARDVVQYGIAQTPTPDAETFELTDVVEKPAVGEAPSTLAVAARYVFGPSIFDYLEQTPPGKGGEIQLTDAMRLMLKDGRTAYGLRLHSGERRFDIGNFDSYFRAFFEFALSDPRYGESLREYIKTILANPKLGS